MGVGWGDTSREVGEGWMCLSRVLSPGIWILELEEDASEGDMEVDSADPWFGVCPLGERFR